ncbi:MAG: yhjX 2 [Firmicutes bacterium]|nr:yhjX 2 [Bacillota bacterium]
MNYDSKRWFYLSVCILTNLCIGIFYAWSVFQRPLASFNGWDGKEVALVFTIVMGTGSFMPLVAGKLQQYMEARWVIFIGGILLTIAVAGGGIVNSLVGLYLVSGVLGGIGNGLIYGSGMSNIVKFFPDKSGMASGLLAAGYGAGAVVWAPLASNLIVAFDVSITFKILAGVFFVICCGLSPLVKSAPDQYRPAGWQPSRSQAQAAGSDKTWRQMLQDTQFYILFLIFVLGTMSGLMVLGFASPIAQDTLKISPQEASVVVGYLALAMVAGKIFWSAISDKIGRYPVFIAIFLLTAIAMVGISNFNTYVIFVSSISIVGMSYGGFLGLMAPVTADIFGTKNLSINFGVMFLTIGVASYMGPRLASLGKTANNGDYTQAFVIAGILSIVGIGLVLLAMYKRKKGETMSLSVRTESV